MASLFEAFVRNFYKVEQSEFAVKRDQTKWHFSSENTLDLLMLPELETDITLRSANRKIIIETKFYKEAFKSRFPGGKINSKNLYQLFAYLKNQKPNDLNRESCEGILLYPVVDKDFEFTYQYEDHKIKVRSINLNQHWECIKNDLLEIIS